MVDAVSVDAGDSAHAVVEQAASEPSRRPGRSHRLATDAAVTGLTVTELSQWTDVPVPTIHHYRRLGMLPEPTSRGRKFTYDERHVDALRVIRVLRERSRLPLDAIRDVLPDVLAVRPDAGHSCTERAETLAALLRSERVEPPDALLAAARRAFNERGYDGASVGDLCEAAEVAKGTFYRHFTCKEEVFAAAVRSAGHQIGSEACAMHGGSSLRTAARDLSLALAPFLPLLLEATSRELRGEPTLSGVTAEVRDAIAESLAPRLGPGRQRAARLVTEEAFTNAVTQALGT